MPITEAEAQGRQPIDLGEGTEDEHVAPRPHMPDRRQPGEVVDGLAQICDAKVLLCCAAGPGPLLAVAASAAESIGGNGPAKAARSVHLQWTAPEATAFYLEATVEQSTGGSYFMACGWSGGYFGVQELRDGKTVAIFSVWDPTKGDDPKAVRPEDRVELLHEGEGVRIRRFGGEGTGGQCMTDFDWKVGETHRFLVRAEAHGPGGEKTAYSGWLFDPATRTWRHLVTFRTRNGGRLLRGLYSFVEDFRRDTRSVEEVRRARFAGGRVRSAEAGQPWRPLSAARFTASKISSMESPTGRTKHAEYWRPLSFPAFISVGELG